MKKRLFSALLVTALLCALFALSGFANTPAYAASYVQHAPSHLQSEAPNIPYCFHCCPSGYHSYSYTFSWIGGLVHENIYASYYFPGGNCTAVTLNWENCWRDMLNATVTNCVNYPGGSGRRWVEADINVTLAGYVNHSTWCAFFVDPHGNFGILQGPEP